MKNKLFILIAGLFFLPQFIFAQKKNNKPVAKEITLVEETQTTTTHYSNGTQKTSSAKHYYFKVGDGTPQGVGYGGKSLRPFVQSSPEAIKELDLCKKNATASSLSLIPMIGGPILALVGAVTIRDEKDNLKPLNPVSITGGVLFVGGYVANIIFSSKCMKHLRKSVDVYNQSIATTSFIKTIRPNNVGVYYNKKVLSAGFAWNIGGRR